MPQRQRQAGHTDRQVDEEHPAPTHRGDQKPAQQRTGGGRDARHRSPQAEGPRACGRRRVGLLQQGQGAGHDERRASPSTRRATTRKGGFGASARAAEDTVNTATPTQKIRRLPSRSPSAPPVSRKPAKTRVYPSVIHWMPVSDAASSRPITGTATLMTVTSRITMKYPAHTASSGAQERRSERGAGSGEGRESLLPADSANATAPTPSVHAGSAPAREHRIYTAGCRNSDARLASAAEVGPSGCGNRPRSLREPPTRLTTLSPAALLAISFGSFDRLWVWRSLSGSCRTSCGSCSIGWCRRRRPVDKGYDHDHLVRWLRAAASRLPSLARAKSPADAWDRPLTIERTMAWLGGRRRLHTVATSAEPATSGLHQHRLHPHLLPPARHEAVSCDSPRAPGRPRLGPGRRPGPRR